MENVKVYNQFGIATGMYVNPLEALSSIANVVSDPINPQQISAGAIVNDIYSSNYKLDYSGWKLFYNGDFEGNSGTFRGALTVGANAWHVDILGNMWWGNYATYAACVSAGGTYISSAGVAKFTNITISGYILVGGAASDVNSNLTTISGTKLTTGTVTADYVVASISISSPSITGGSISIGSGNAIFKADASGIYLGNAIFASAPFRVNMNGEVTATKITISTTDSSYTGSPIAETYIGNLTASKITSGTIDASVISVTNINAGNISTGTLSGITIQTSSGNSKVMLQSDTLKFYAGGSLKATLDGSSAGSGGVKNTGDFFVANNKSYFITSSGGGSTEYGGISITSGNAFWLTMGTANTFYLYNNAQNDAYFTASNTRIYAGRPFGFQVRSGTPGAASSFQGYMYYDTDQSDIVFSNGSGWYKVTAEAI